MTRAVPRHLAVALLLWCVAPRTGEAQIGGGQRDPSGLGAVSGGVPGKLTSVLTIGVDGGVDDTNRPIVTSAFDPSNSDGSGILGDPSVAADPQFRGVQYFSSVRALLSLGKRSDLFGWQLTGGTSVRFYPGLQQVVRVRDNLNASATVPVGRRLRIFGYGFLAYSPYYSLASALSPGAVVDPVGVDGQPVSVAPTSPTALDPSTTADDYALVRRSAYTSSTAGGFTYRLGQYSSLIVQGGTQRTDFVESTAPSLHGWDARFRYMQQISEHTSVHVGYGRRVARFYSSSLNAPAQLEDLDIGIDHSRAWSLTRNTTLRVAPGIAVTKNGGTRRYNVTASASLEHLLRRTGSVGVRYDRQAGLIGGLVQPVFTDTFSARYSENLSRRLSLYAAAAYLLGQVGTTSTSANDYRSYDAQVRLSCALTTQMFLRADYLLYTHDFGADVQLLGSIAAVQRRQSVRLGLTLRFPLLNGRP